MVNIFKDKKFLKECAIILLVGIIVNSLCFLMPLVVHAESPINYYPVTSGQNNMQVLSLEQIFYECNSLASYDFSNVNYVIFIDDISTPSYPYGRKYNVLVWDKVLNENPFYIELEYGGTYFQFHKISNTASTFSYRIYSFQDWKGDLSDVNDTAVYYSERLNYLNGDSPLYRNTCDYVFNTSIFLNQPDNLISPVLQYLDNGINIGDFVDLPGLDEILNNINNTWEPPSSLTGHALPSQPTENSNNNDFQNRLQMFDYLKDSINAIVGNLGYNIKNWFDNLIGKMVEGFNSVSQNIYNGFKTLMDNIKDFFAPKVDVIIEKLNYITQDFDSSTVLASLDNTDFKQDFDSLASFHDELEDLLDIQEPTEYSLVLHLGQINDDYISLAGDQEIDISFLHNSTLFRTFAWCIVVSGLAFIVASGIPSMLRGDKGD